MPTLKDIHCSIELSNGKAQLREFGTTYRDGGVETFVAIPESSKPFTVHLKSSSFIAPGLAMYVFIDGVYQCNRNRQNLKLRQPLGRKSLVDFVVRQKEERQEDGTMMATEWSLAMLDLDKAPRMGSSNLTENIGCIEVIVLRCAGTRSAKCASKDDAKGINLDGANDLPDHWDFHTPGGPQYDDRSWQHVGSNAHPSRYDASTRASSYHNSGPPPPLPSHSYVTNTHYNSPVPRQGTGNFVPGYRYGSGPIAHQSRVPSVVGPASSVAGAGAPAIDLAWLDNRLADAVNRGFEKYQGSKASPPSQPISAAPAVGYSVSAPGAWPLLPEDLVLDTDPKPQSHQSNAHISWDVPLAARAQSDEKGYYSISETSSSDSWGEQKHRDKKQNSKQGSDVRDRRFEHDTHGWTSVRHQQTSPAIRSHQTGDWARSSDFHSARSRPQEPVWESRSDKDGWTIVNAGSGHNDPWRSPRSVHPSESISVAIPAPDLLATKLHSLSVRDGKSQRRSASAAQSSNWESVPPWGALETDGSLAGVPPFSTAGYAWDVPKKQTSKNVAATSNSDNGWSTVERAVSPVGWGTKEVKSTGWETEEAKSTGWEAEEPKVTGWDDEDEKSTSWDIEKSKPTDWKFETVKATDWDTKADKPSGLDTEKGKPASWDIKHRKSQAWWEPQDTKVDGWDTVDTKPTDWDIKETKVKPWPCKETLPASPKDEHKHHHKTATQTPPKQASLSRWLVSEPTDKAPKPDPWTAAAAPVKPVPSTQKPKYTATPSRYEHPIGRPIYIDTPEKPYASFVFKYRSHDYLQSHLGSEVPNSVSRCVKALSEPVREVAKREMQDVPRDKLIEKLVALEGKVKKVKAKEKHKKVTERDQETEYGEDSKTEIEGARRTKEWVEKMSWGEKKRGN